MKVCFWIDKDEEKVELDDDMTEEEIQSEFDMWLAGVIHCGWYIEEDD